MTENPGTDALVHNEGIFLYVRFGLVKEVASPVPFTWVPCVDDRNYSPHF
jgi:hypothetical protein